VIAAVLAFVLSLTGCPDDESMTDAGPADAMSPDAGTGLPTPAAPAPPAAPTAPSRACPDGWVRTARGCAPFATEPTCTDAEPLAIPGAETCVRVGAACPAGEFAAPPASGAVLYVSATATAPGDGSAAAPFDSLSRAAAAVRSGTTILLGKGTHEGEVQPPAGSTLRGACASETTLTPSFPHESAPTILVERADVTVSDLTISGPRPGLIALGAGNSVTLRGVVVDGTTALGIMAQGGTIDAEEVVVRDVQGIPAFRGRAADAIRDGTLRLRRSMLADGDNSGMVVRDGGHVELTDVLLRDLGELGIQCLEGGTAELTRTAIMRIEGGGLIGNHAGTTITAEDVYIADIDVGAPAGAGIGRGVNVGAGASLTARGLAISNVSLIGLFSGEVGSSATIEDAFIGGADVYGLYGNHEGSISAHRVVIDDAGETAALASSGATIALEDVTVTGGTLGLRAQLDGQMTVARALVEGATDDAFLSSDGSTLDAEDITVRAMTPGSPLGARGAATFRNGVMNIRRADISDAIASGVYVGEESVGVIEDVRIVDTQPLEDRLGLGVSVWGGTLTADRVHVERSHTIGLALGLTSNVTIRDVVIRTTAPEPLSGNWGRGISAQGPNDQLVVERGVFEDFIAAGVFASGAGTHFDLRDVVIRDVVSRDCGARPSCVTAGMGLVVVSQASAELTGFLVADNAAVGAQIIDAELDLHDGEVRGHPIGINVQVPGYDLARLSDDVRYLDNGTNLDSEDLPVPPGNPDISMPAAE